MTPCPTNHKILVISFTSIHGKGIPTCPDCHELLTVQEWWALRMQEERELININQGNE